MAEVFLAKELDGDGHHVVIKRVLPHLCEDPAFVRMLVHEAHIAARLTHPNIVRTHELGRERGMYFIAMEYVQGEDLSALGKRAEGPFPPGVALRIACDACAALHHAHEARDNQGAPLGIVHRDVSPENMVITPAGDVKLVDFGVAKATALGGHTLDGRAKGKHAYMAPEQFLGRAIDHRTDQFSTAVVIWELLAGRRLFRREADWLTMSAVVEEEAPTLRSIRADVPATLDEVLARALAKKPDERYPCCHAFAKELERVGEAEGWDMSKQALAHWLRGLFTDESWTRRVHGPETSPWAPARLARKRIVVPVAIMLLLAAAVVLAATWLRW